MPLDPDILDSTVTFTDSRGYHYVGISESWKRMCLHLPCSERVQVPPIYKEQHLATKLDGHDVVIQVWKGNCPKAFREMPGGIGGEVGIYRKIPGKQIPNLLEIPRAGEFPVQIRPFVVAAVSRLLKTLVELVEHGVELWWPFPELEAQIEMKLLHPDNGDEFFTAQPEPAGGYWMSRWMNYESYDQYIAHESQHRPAVARACDYHMELSVKGHRFRWDEPESEIRAV